MTEIGKSELEAVPIVKIELIAVDFLYKEIIEEIALNAISMNDSVKAALFFKIIWGILELSEHANMTVRSCIEKIRKVLRL